MERRTDNYATPPRYIEPRQLTLNADEPRENSQGPVYDDSASFPLDPALRSEGPPLPGYTSLDYSRPLSPGFDHERRMGFPHGGDGPFLWGGDYAPGTADPHDLPRLPYEDWVDPVLHGRQDMDYDRLPFPSMGFPQPPFPSMDDTFGQYHHGTSFAPPPMFPPFMYGPSPGEGGPPFGDPFPPQLPQNQLGLPPPGSNLPLLPSLSSLHLGNQVVDSGSQPSSAVQTHAPEKIAGSSRKPRVDRRNAKPLTIEELAHDNSRFAKVVKAFLSIEEPESRTVPEIAKRVSEMYAGQYADFEGVKRMVNDVLQKHKAFWHPGRGSPYQLNLLEGRARREFPSNSKHMRGFDENLFYPGRSDRRKARKSFSRRGADAVSDRDVSEPVEQKVPHPGGANSPFNGSLEDNSSLFVKVLADAMSMHQPPSDDRIPGSVTGPSPT